MTRKRQEFESPEELKQRHVREAQAKREEIAADDAAIDRMIRRNIEQFGA